MYACAQCDSQIFIMKSQCQLPARITYSEATQRLAGKRKDIVHISIIRAASAVPAALEVGKYSRLTSLVRTHETRRVLSGLAGIPLDPMQCPGVLFSEQQQRAANRRTRAGPGPCRGR